MQQELHFFQTPWNAFFSNTSGDYLKKAFRTIPEDFLDTAEAQILKSKKAALQYEKKNQLNQSVSKAT